MKTLPGEPSAGSEAMSGCRKLTSAVGRKRQRTGLPRAGKRTSGRGREGGVPGSPADGSNGDEQAWRESGRLTLMEKGRSRVPDGLRRGAPRTRERESLLAGALVRLLRGPGKVAVGPDDVAVVVGRVEAGDGVVGRAGFRLAVAAVAEDRDDADAAQRGGVVAVVRVLVLPAIQDGDLLNVLGHQDGGEVGLGGGLEVGQVDVAGGGGAGGGGTRLVGQPREHGGTDALGVSQGPLLLRLLQSVEEVRDQQGGDDPDDGDDDQQLDQSEATLPVTETAQHSVVLLPSRGHCLSMREAKGPDGSCCDMCMVDAMRRSA